MISFGNQEFWSAIDMTVPGKSDNRTRGFALGCLTHQSELGLVSACKSQKKGFQPSPQ